MTVTCTGGIYAHWPNGAELRVFGLAHPKTLGDSVQVVADAPCDARSWPPGVCCKAWNHIGFGLRLGAHSKGVATRKPGDSAGLADPRTVGTGSRLTDHPLTNCPPTRFVPRADATIEHEPPGTATAVEGATSEAPAMTRPVIAPRSHRFMGDLCYGV